jgi:hypothetical protein
VTTLHVAAVAAAGGKIPPIVEVLDSPKWQPAESKLATSREPGDRTTAPKKRTRPALPEPAQKRKKIELAVKDQLPPKAKKMVKR